VRKKRTLLICAACALLAILAVFAYKPASREPSYDGHPLSYWVASLGRTGTPESDLEKATNAIDHIGVAAFPFLIKWIPYSTPNWRPTVGNWLRRRPFPFAQPMSVWIMEPRAKQLDLGTRSAFRVLGERAVGPLLAVATNAHHPAHLAAINTVSTIPELGDRVQLLLPAITNCLNPTNTPFAQILASYSLANLKPQISGPVLVSYYLNSPNSVVRHYSAIALGNRGLWAFAPIPALTNALADPDPGVRERAAAALHRIAPDTFTNATSQ
jgi:hypothetical protein